MKSVIYPGSFDPITNGHLDIIERVSILFDKVYVCVAENINKKTYFSTEERVLMVKDACKKFDNIEVISTSSLIVKKARELGCDAIVRGLRAVTDFEYELQLAQTNHILNPEVETIFLTTNLQYSYLSSTIVKEIASYGGDIYQFVPPEFIDRVYAKYNVERNR